MMRLEVDLATDWPGFRLAARGSFDLDGVTAIFGPSGAGKSTILAAIAGFRPGAGRIAVGGEIWQEARRMIPPHRRPVGMVFQDGRLFDHLSVAGNLGYAARRADRSGPEIRLRDVVDALGLGDLEARRPATLSGGERQRVAIGRALLTRPRLMLMDEPLAALDRQRKAAILPLIAALPERFGVPVLFVTHQLDEIVQIADRLIAIRAGKITGEGPVADMVAQLDPEVSGRFEAGVVLEGRLAASDPGFAMTAIEVAGHRLLVPGLGAGAEGDAMRLRIRARDVSLALAPVAGVSIRNQLPGTVTAIGTDDGPFAEITLDCDGQILRARITRAAVADLGLAPGTAVWALIKSISFDRRLGRG